jgi:muramoyltetrapeptide carboxypeptidase
MPGCCESEDTSPLDGAITRALHDLEIPIAIGLPSGHTRSPGVTLPFGVRARLACDSASASLRLCGTGVQ